MKKYLDYKELQQLDSVTLSAEQTHLQRVLDMFLFSCYTGVGSDEIIEIDSSLVRRTLNKTWITVGVGESELREIPISMLFATKPERLLKQYQYDFTDVAPVTSDEFAELSKVIKEQTEIDVDLCFDVAQCTFAMCLVEKGVQATTIQKLLGHPTIERTTGYLCAANIEWKVVQQGSNNQL